ncbi:MAG: histidinol phosphate phosphatase domain-containing protein [Candidatus Omnitrophota bacterium]
MIDLHTHSLLSDGEFLVSELTRRAEEKGYEVIGVTDHVDSSNIEKVIDGLLKASSVINKHSKIRMIPGVEITHVPPKAINSLVKLSRSKGIKLILVHGETIVECVKKGTNREAILSRPTILTHPGLITIEDGRLAAKNGVYLEISARKGHSLTNGHVANIAKSVGAKLVLNTDSHTAADLITKDEAVNILLGSGLKEKEIKDVFKNSRDLASRMT